MIRFISHDPVSDDDFDIIFNHPTEIQHQIRLLCENSVPIDSYVLHELPDKKFSKENLFTFFYQANPDYFSCEVFNPPETGQEIVRVIRDIDFRRANGETVEMKAFFQFIYEYLEIRYIFFSPVLGIDTILHHNQSLLSIRFAYPLRIKKFDKRNDYRLKLSPDHPVVLNYPGYFEVPLIDFSSGGLAIPNQLYQSAQIGDLVDFYLSLPRIQERILLRGEIRHLSATRVGLRYLPFASSKGEITVYKRKILIIQQFIENEAARQHRKRQMQKPRPEIDQTANLPTPTEESAPLLDKPTLLIIDNDPGTLYNFLNLKYQLIRTPYFRAETIHKLNRIHLILFNPDYSNFITIASFLKNSPIAAMTPVIVMTQHYTRDNILNIKRTLDFKKILRIPFQASQLISSIETLLQIFPLQTPLSNEFSKLKLLSCKFLFVSNIPIITYGLSRIMRQAGFLKTATVNDSGKLMNSLATFRPDIMIIDSAMNEINPFRLSPILKRNPSYKRIKIIILLTQPTPDYIEKVKLHQIDRFIFYPCRGDDLLDLIKSLEFEMVKPIP
ncbi:MAG: response regulator [Candidatus Delongbacteria bacterium]|nr:response regulator [Candidatus Delongbacteria bacterium]